MLPNWPMLFKPPNGVKSDVSPGLSRTERRLSDLHGCFSNEAAFREITERSDPLVYVVVQTDGGDGTGLLTGWCLMQPGRVGDEYFMTRGHVHKRPRAEVYYCVSGQGILVMQRDTTCETIQLEVGSLAYVPPGWSHRHINTGSQALFT